MKKMSVQMAKFKPRDAVIAVTYNCNSRCQMCNIWQMKSKKPFFAAEELRNLPTSLKSVNLSGGEPFLRDDLPRLVDIIRKRCPVSKIIISTNGFATDLILKKMEEIKKIDENIGVAVSLDGIGEVHEQIRGVPGAYQKVLATITGLKEMGIKNVKIGFTLGDHNVDQLKKVYELSKKLGVEFSFAFVHSSDNYFSKINEIKRKDEIIYNINWLIMNELNSWDAKRWARAYFAYGAEKFILTSRRVLPDYSGKLNIFIDAFGDIFPCDVATQKIGNLKNINDTKPLDVNQNCAQSWMICTARQSMKKHKLKVISWIITNKTKLIWESIFNKDSLKQ